ncbi:hypothetical protein C8F01DRAFT_1105657 [Mycena amicta]|nr:hypothetical protein C8F01DRAFT_1105657 [Mycena amicta]
MKAEVSTGVDEEVYEKWLRDSRARLDEELRRYKLANAAAVRILGRGQTGTSISISGEQPARTHSMKWICEIDLDHQVFLVDNNPVFSLRNMPPSDELFHEYLGFDSYGHRSYAISTPEEYRYSWKAAPPSIDQEVEPRFVVQQAPLVKLLEIPDSDLEFIPDYEASHTALLELIVGGHMQNRTFGTSIRALETVVNPLSISEYLKSWGQQIMRLAFGSMIFGLDGDECKADTTPELRSNTVWLTPNVCLRFATHLDDESNLKQSVLELFTFMEQVSRTRTMYGVLFSLFHCVVVRVDCDASVEKVIRATPPLQFLPSLHATSPSTSGIAAIARLACHVRSPLTTYTERKGGGKTHFLHDVPPEILQQIAGYLGPADLGQLASAAPSLFAAAAWTVLRYPYVGGYHLLRVHADAEQPPAAQIRSNMALESTHTHTFSVQACESETEDHRLASSGRDPPGVVVVSATAGQFLLTDPSVLRFRRPVQVKQVAYAHPV